MSEMQTVPGILAVINSITANRESGRLEIDASGTPGTFLFNQGKLVHASLGSLKGFPAVNAAVAVRDVQFIFDHVAPASHVSTITPNERVVLKRFFGIEAADAEGPVDAVEPDWNPAPEPVVPLAEVEETPTVEVAPPVRARSFAFFSKPVIAASLALLLALAVGAIALRSRMKARQEVASVATVAQPEPVVQPESKSVSEPQPEVKPVAAPPVTTFQPRNSASHDAKVQDLSGEWRIINTVQKTRFKPYDKMQVGFRLRINQQGKQFTAKGEKFSENGQTLPAASRTPIELTGSVEGDKVVATFIEDGRMRRTNGRFVWKIQNDGLAGTFISTAANSSGRSAMTKH